MLSAIVAASLARPRIVLLAALVLAIYGGLTAARARYDVFPEFVPAQASVQTEAPGMTADQVEILVTKPLEDVLNGANGVASVRSESTQGLSAISITFGEGADPYRSRQIVAEQLAQAAGALPAGVKAPVVTPLTSSTMDLLKVGFVSDKLNQTELRDVIEWTVRPRLLAVNGVARANLFGGSPSRLEVRVRREDLIARKLSMGDVENAVRAATQVRGGGFVDTPAQRILVEPVGQATTPEALGAAVVAPGGGLPILMRDVADVVRAASPQYGDTSVMGRPGVLLTLSSQYGANTLQATRGVEAALADLRPTLEAQGVRIYPAIHRPASFIETALAHIEMDLVIGGALILAVLLLFLRSPRVALVAFVSIPLSLLTSVVVLDAFGQTINTMSLGGLAVALGVVIDDAVVDVENIVRRLRLADKKASMRETVLHASIEVRAPIVYATFVLAATVAPILFLSGLQGAFFSPLAFAFILATIASLAVALTVTPAFALLLLKRVNPPEEFGFLHSLKAAHSRLMRGLCRHPRTGVAVTALAGALTIGSFFLFGSSLLPSFREHHYVLQLNGPPGASFEWMRQIGGRVTHDLLDIPGVDTVSHQIGRATAGEDTWPPNRSEFHVQLKEAVTGKQEDQILERIRGVLATYPGVSTEALTFLGDRIGESLSGETAAVAINIYGPDLDTLDKVGGQIAAVVGKLPGAADVQLKSPPATPMLRMALDQTRLGLKGLSSTDAYDAIEGSLQGRSVSQVTDGQRISDVVVTTAGARTILPETAGSIGIDTAASGGTLSEVADLKLTQGRSSILHDGARRRQIVTVNPTAADIGGFVAKARSEIAKQVQLPPSVYLEYTGVAKSQAAAARQIAVNVSAAMIGVIALLVLAFGGGRAAILILAGAPFALLGGAAAVALTGGILSLGSLVGFVTLFGISARNAILLVSHADHLVEAEGQPWGLDTVLRATRERVTPILMTALVTGLGLLPLALGAGEVGREIQGPMATVILGGLVTSTIMTLFIMPALLLAFRHGRRAMAEGLRPAEQ